MLAARSKELLERYRKGEPVGTDCPLAKALGNDPQRLDSAFDPDDKPTCV